jgi:hypothetical protein
VSSCSVLRHSDIVQFAEPILPWSLRDHQVDCVKALGNSFY